MNCIACNSAVGEDVLLLCTSCRDGYHYTCLNIPTDHYRSMLRNCDNKWRCPSCSNVARRRKHEDTPVHKHYEQSSSTHLDADMSICDDSLQHDNSKTGDLNRSDVLTLPTKGANIAADLDSGNIIIALSNMLDTKLSDVKKDLLVIDSKLSTTKQEIFREIKNEFVHAIESIKKEFSDTTDFMSEQIKTFTGDLSTLDKKVKTLELENSRLNAEIIILKKNQHCHPIPSEIHNTIHQMQIDINEREQANLLNELEITGIPEHQGESILHLVQAMALKLGTTVDDCDVIGVERVGPAQAAGRAGTATRPRPRPLVVRLARRTQRDQLLRSARVRRGLDSGGIGLPEHMHLPVYVNERLTKTNRRIFWKARQAGGAANWKFVWTRDGRIFAKRTDSNESRAVQIRSEKDILCVFGVDPTASEGS